MKVAAVGMAAGPDLVVPDLVVPDLVVPDLVGLMAVELAVGRR